MNELNLEIIVALLEIRIKRAVEYAEAQMSLDSVTVTMSKEEIDRRREACHEACSAYRSAREALMSQIHKFSKNEREESK